MAGTPSSSKKKQASKTTMPPKKTASAASATPAARAPEPRRTRSSTKAATDGNSQVKSESQWTPIQKNPSKTNYSDEKIKVESDDESDDESDESEYTVQKILGHSFVPDPATAVRDGSPLDGAEDPRFLVAWSGVDPGTRQPWAATWEAFVDVGAPLIVAYFHALALRPARVRSLTEPRDGRVYAYADSATSHRLCSTAAGTAGADAKSHTKEAERAPRGAKKRKAEEADLAYHP